MNLVRTVPRPVHARFVPGLYLVFSWYVPCKYTVIIISHFIIQPSSCRYLVHPYQVSGPYVLAYWTVHFLNHCIFFLVSVSVTHFFLWMGRTFLKFWQIKTLNTRTSSTMNPTSTFPTSDAEASLSTWTTNTTLAAPYANQTGIQSFINTQEVNHLWQCGDHL